MITKRTWTLIINVMIRSSTFYLKHRKKMVDENIILSQGRDPGDPIYNGYTLKVTISKKPEDKTEPTDPLLPSDDKTE